MIKDETKQLFILCLTQPLTVFEKSELTCRCQGKLFSSILPRDCVTRPLSGPDFSLPLMNMDVHGLDNSYHILLLLLLQCIFIAMTGIIHGDTQAAVSGPCIITMVTVTVACIIDDIVRAGMLSLSCLGITQVIVAMYDWCQC